MVRNRPVLCLILGWTLGLSACGRSDSSDTRNNDIRPSPFPESIKRAPSDPSGLEYWVLVSQPIGDSDDDGYDNDSTVRFFGTSLDGGAVVYVNDSPVRILGEGGEIFRISEWLSPGKNTVRVGGDFQQELYIKVFALRVNDFHAPDWKFERMVAKARITPGKNKPRKGVEADLVFIPDIDYAPFFDELRTGADGSQQVETEVRTFLESIMAALQGRHYDEFKKMALAPWEDRPRWGTKRVNDDRIPSLRKAVEDSKLKLVTKPADFQLIIGRYSVLVVSGEDEGFLSHGYHSLEFRNHTSGEKEYARPMRLVRVSGRWEIWEG